MRNNASHSANGRNYSSPCSRQLIYPPPITQVNNGQLATATGNAHGNLCANPTMLPTTLLTASPQTLMAFGLPLHGTNMPIPAWNSLVAHAIHRLCATSALSHTQPNSSTTESSDDWSGYVVPSANDTITESDGYWNVPCTVYTMGESYHDVAEWVGIGGYPSGNNDLMQVGTDQMVNDGVETNQAFYQTQALKSSRIYEYSYCGDTMYGAVNILWNGHGYTGYLYLEDSTQNWSYSNQVSMSSIGNYGRSADFIVERPLENITYLYYLTDFHPVTFNFIEATYGGTQKWAGDFNTINVYIIDTCNFVLAYAGSLYTYTYTDYWYYQGCSQQQ